MAQFSTNEQVSLEKTISSGNPPVSTPDDQIDFQYDLENCTNWIKSNNYKKVCLQFPDFLLPDSSKVAKRLQETLSQTVYILGDTAYESCCIDYVAAAHVDADAVIHFGPKCFSKPTNDVPSLFIYQKHSLNIEEFCKLFHCNFGELSVKPVVVLNEPFVHLLGKIQESLGNVVVVKGVGGDLGEFEGCSVVYVGDNDRKLMNFSFIFKPKELFYFDGKTLGNYQTDSKILKKRYFLSEKIKDSKTVGIVIGTVAVKNYLNVINRIKSLLKIHNKQHYLISVGKPTVAKLANFPEMDIYVLISCSMNEIFDSREFYAPIVTPFDIETSLNPNSSHLPFTYDFNSSPQTPLPETPLDSDLIDVSLLTGKIRSSSKVEERDGMEVAVRDVGAVANCGGNFLGGRSWKGLEQDLGKSEVKLAEEGRKGIAQGYVNEVE